MKRLFLCFALLVSLSLIYSCRKDNPVTKTSASNSNGQSMAGSINGSQVWAADSFYSFSNSGLIVIICKNRSDGSQISIQIPSNIAAGSYITTSQNSEYNVNFTIFGLNSYLSYGSLNISSNSNNTITGSISGAFSFIDGGSNSLNLNIDSFKINYQPIATSLSANINGTSWNALNFKTYKKINAGFGDTVLYISGSQSNSTNNDSVTLSVPLNTLAGTYGLSNPRSSQYSVSYFRPASGEYDITTGKMTVTMNNGTFISGNFQGTLTPNAPNGTATQLTNGDFFIRYR